MCGAAGGVDGVAQEQPHDGDTLVVAAASRVQLRTDRSGDLGDAVLDDGVDVFEGRVELDGSALELRSHLIQRPVERIHLLGVEHVGLRQCPDVCLTVADVVRRQVRIEMDRRGVALGDLGGVGAEPCLPKRAHRLLLRARQDRVAGACRLAVRGPGRDAARSHSRGVGPLPDVALVFLRAPGVNLVSPDVAVALG